MQYYVDNAELGGRMGMAEMGTIGLEIILKVPSTYLDNLGISP